MWMARGLERRASFRADHDRQIFVDRLATLARATQTCGLLIAGSGSGLERWTLGTSSPRGATGANAEKLLRRGETSRLLPSVIADPPCRRTAGTGNIQPRGSNEA